MLLQHNVTQYRLVTYRSCLCWQVDKMIGKGAPEDFIHNLEQLASTHHADMSLDHIRAYYFGQRFIVEMEVVLPPRMTVRESHDIAMILQHKVCSSLAFAVHTSYFTYTPSSCLCLHTAHLP